MAENKPTLATLEAAQREKEDLIARLWLQDSDLKQQKRQQEDQYKAALKAQDKDKAYELLQLGAQIEAEQKVLADQIEYVNQDKPFTDQDCIDAANAEAAADIAQLAKMRLKYYKACTELGLLMHDMAEVYMQANQRRRKCLFYHTAYRSSQEDAIYANQGLTALTPIPDARQIEGLLRTQFGNDETTAMIAISNGVEVPDFIREV